MFDFSARPDPGEVQLRDGADSITLHPEMMEHSPAAGSNWLLVLAGVYVAASTIAFALYGFDKSAARGGRRRVAENTLHLWSLLGGWPGAFAGQRVFRHKTSKVSFQIVFWLTVVLNCASTVWLLTGAGGRLTADVFPKQVAPANLPRITPGPRSSDRR